MFLEISNCERIGPKLLANVDKIIPKHHLSLGKSLAALPVKDASYWAFLFVTKASKQWEVQHFKLAETTDWCSNVSSAGLEMSKEVVSAMEEYVSLFPASNCKELGDKLGNMKICNLNNWR